MRWDEWRFSAKRAWQDSFVKWMTVCTVLFHVAMSAFALHALLPQGARARILTVHYTIYLGIDDVRPWQWILLLPAILLLILFVNGVVACGLFRQDKLAAKTLVAFSVLLTLVWGVNLFFLVSVNL